MRKYSLPDLSINTKKGLKLTGSKTLKLKASQDSDSAVYNTSSKNTSVLGR